MATTNHLGFTTVSQSQSQKEVTVNNALKLIDAILNTGAVDKDLYTPPGGPTEGAVYIVSDSSTATGDWAGRENDIALYYDGAWNFLTPNEGFTIWVNDEDNLYVWTSAAWETLITAVAFQDVPMIGINTTADGTNRLSVLSDAALFTAETDDIRVVLSKDDTGDVASFIFQNNFDGRAEFGLIGDDDFHFKVSPDGSTFYESFIIDKDNGDVAFQQFIKLSAPSELTIASGVVTAVKSSHKIDTQGNAASDDLDTINGGSEGCFLLIQPENDTRTVVVKNGTGNIRTKSGADVSLDSYGDTMLLYFDGTNWLEV